MSVFVLIREDQNEDGYVDTSITRVFHEESYAKQQQDVERRNAREQGLAVEDDDSDGDWQVSWKVERHTVS